MVGVDDAIAAIPAGWRLFTVDMSIEQSASVTLKGVQGHIDYVNETRTTLAAALIAASGVARNTHRGWVIDRDFIGHWRAIHPEFDGEGNTVQLANPARDSLITEIDTWIEEHSA
jgi:hypothetical protein